MYAVLVPTTTTAFMSLFQKSIRYVIWTTRRNSKAKTWVYHVKCLLCVNGFGYVWMYGDVGDERRFLHVFKERLKDCFYQRWWTHISNSERFDLYHCFKSRVQCERYIGYMQSRIYKTALERFRLGVSRINCHRLRFSAAFDLRNCSFCTTSTEDECHMLFQCPAYTDLRTNFSFETTARTGSLKEQYVQILCSANANTLLNLSKLIFLPSRASLITS